MAPVGNGTVQKTATSSSSVMSSFMCCTSERSGQTYQRSYREHNQSKYFWLDPTRWVEKRTVKKEKVGGVNNRLGRAYKFILQKTLCVCCSASSSMMMMTSLPSPSVPKEIFFAPPPPRLT